MPSQICQRTRDPPSILLASQGLGIIRDAELWRLFRARNKRHTFAVDRLLAWYRDGQDINARLPALATYLGHVNIRSTQVYLRPTAELLAEVNERFHDHFLEKVKPQGGPT